MRASLGSLVPTGADEAMALIPSLSKEKISEEDLEELCKDLQRLKMQAQL